MVVHRSVMRSAENLGSQRWPAIGTVSAQWSSFLAAIILDASSNFFMRGTAALSDSVRLGRPLDIEVGGRLNSWRRGNAMDCQVGIDP